MAPSLRADSGSSTKKNVACLDAQRLTDVFVWLSFRDRITTAQVSHSWRSASLGAPERLWSRIPSDDRPHVLEALLERAGEAPVELVEVWLSGRTARSIGRCIEKHMPHIARLTLCFQDGIDAPEFQMLALSQPAPILSYFALNDYGANRIAFRGGKFAGNAPKLHTLHLVGISLGMCDVLANLRRLSFTNDNITTRHLILLFTTCRRLEYLNLKMKFYDHEAYGSPTPQIDEPIVPPDCMRTLLLHISAFDSELSFSGITNVVHQGIPLIDLTLHEDVWLEQSFMIIPLMSVSPREMDIRFTPHTTAVRFTEPDGRKRSYRNLPGVGAQLDDGEDTALTFSFDLDRVSDVTRASIRGFWHLEGRTFEGLISLRELTIIVEPGFRIPAPCEGDEASFECPQLQFLRFAAPETSRLRTIRKTDVVRFVRNMLKLRRKLARIEFCGLQTDGPVDDLRVYAKEVIHNAQPALDFEWEGDAEALLA
ncbi:hypothetical protein EXIGLDRAFT_751036 [Exidia glandulosa HHB12029]|uniref:F-box domain-containing protein n=1 Tax=Exidia glandulosa HHB12029 TaxID=1314781 RepID=A0A165FYG2_EXIGL|nr:hypothetical protein EXIGLDRAFT_751036 [Exidia glandulosa HHB12029]